jgi:Type IV secretion system pilin
MKNVIQKVLLSSLAVTVGAQAQLASAISFGEGNVSQGIQGTSKTADTAVQDLIGTAATFLAILAVVYAIYGGFNILTAGGAEDKVKKGKTILIQAAIGLVVIWLANSVVQWLITKLLTPSA